MLIVSVIYGVGLGLEYVDCEGLDFEFTDCVVLRVGFLKFVYCWGMVEEDGGY